MSTFATAAPAKKVIKEQHRGIATLLAFALLPISGFATDIYIPSLPSMAGALHVGNMQVQFTLTLFLISYGVTQLFIGSLLDSFGRYHICFWSLVIFAGASLVIANTQSIYLIYLMRVVHGITVGGIVVSKRAFFIDMFSGEKLKHYLSMFSIIWSTGPIVAPFIGGYLETSFGWKSNFYFLGGLAALLAIGEWLFSGETLKHAAEFKLRTIAKTYLGMLRTMDFALGLIMIGLAYCMIMIYNMTGPFIIEHTLHLTPVITGYSSLVLGLAWMVGGIIGKQTINKPFFSRTATAIALQIVFAIAMLVTVHYIQNLFILIFFAFIIHVAAGFTFNNFFTYCLGRFPKNAGIASGLSGGVNYVMVSFISYAVIVVLPAKDAINLGWSYFILIVACVLVMMGLRLRKDALG